MSYASAVLKANHVVETKNTRVEATEGGIRLAMYDPTKLYTACLGGPTIVKTLATPPGGARRARDEHDLHPGRHQFDEQAR